MQYLMPLDGAKVFKKFKQAKGFYLVIAASTMIGLWINFIHIDPIKALVYTAVGLKR